MLAFVNNINLKIFPSQAAIAIIFRLETRSQKKTQRIIETEILTPNPKKGDKTLADPWSQY